MRIFLILMIYLCSFQVITAQVKGLTIKGYVDTYYAAYNNDIKSNAFQPMAGVSPRNNSFGINIARLSLHYYNKNVRSNVGFHFGDLPLAAWNKGGFKNVQEANVGLHIYKDLWVDAGLFLSHLGEENYNPKDNIMSIWSVSGFCGPSYQTGAKLSYEGFENMDLELWVMNGYEKVYDNNDVKSYGCLMRYRFASNRFLSYSMIVGDESDDPRYKAMRWHQHLYVHWALADYLNVSAGLDVGKQNQETFGGVWTLTQVKLAKRHSLSARYEFFKDYSGVISGTFPIPDEVDARGIDLSGVTVGYEFRPQNNSYLRAESRFVENLTEGQLLYGNNASQFACVFTAGYYFDKDLI